MLARFVYGDGAGDHNRRVVMGGISGLLLELVAIISLEKTDTPYGHELGSMSADACEIAIAIVGGMLFCLLGFVVSGHLSFYTEAQQSRNLSAKNVWSVFLIEHLGEENRAMWRWARDNNLLKEGTNKIEIDPNKLLRIFPTPDVIGWQGRPVLDETHLRQSLNIIALPQAQQMARDDAAQEAARAQPPN